MPASRPLHSPVTQPATPLEKQPVLRPGLPLAMPRLTVWLRTRPPVWVC